MGNLFDKELSAEDKANRKLEIPIETLKVRDKAEELKLKFPFYRMEIDVFEYKLNQITKDNFRNSQNGRWNTRSVTTDVFPVW